MSGIDVRLLDLPPCEVGEGIVWCDRVQALWWVDIGASRVHRHAPATGRTDQWDMPGNVGCLALTEGDEVVVALTGGLHLLDPQNGSLSLLAPYLDMPADHRPNDGAVSGAGRFYIGSVALGDRRRPDGGLWMFDPQQGIRRLLGGLHVANGLAFAPDDRTAYLSDSWPEVRTIWAFDHDASTGDLSRRRIFFDTSATAGRHDGACIDEDGYYWMAGVGGGEILRLSPAGEIDFHLAVPVSRPSKPCFGGSNLRTLYVTSIGLDRAPNDSDGKVLAIEVPYRGLTGNRLRLRKSAG